MKIEDLFEAAQLEEMLNQGFVRRQVHPCLSYAILNYSELTQFSRTWNPVTRQCRGLIYNTFTSEVVARPYRKFLNVTEPGAYEGRPDEPVVVTEKHDGSLGVGYPTPKGYAIATRGSFTSEQARHATILWEELYADRVTVPAGVTPLWEIVYPANRIVVSYGDFDDLILLGAVDIESGRSLTPTDAADLIGWPGPVTEVFPYRTYAEALKTEPRPNKEGFVIHFPEADERAKLKYEEYVTLHRLLTGCTARRLWESLSVNACAPYGDVKFMTRKLFLSPERINGILTVGAAWLGPFTRDVPEEFRDWVFQRVGEMEHAIATRHQQLIKDFHAAVSGAGVVKTDTPTREDSKVFATYTRAHCGGDFNLMMSMWRGHEIESTLWREIRPEHELPYRAVDESVA